MDHTLGLDIGGANIKWFHTAGHADSVPFAMWRHPLRLASALIDIAATLPPTTRWSVTMTGEMADVFHDRNDGVQTIVGETSKAAATLGIVPPLFYAIPGTFVTPAEAIQQPTSVASANWHALAKWASTWVDRPSLLLDIGTTTADLIPISPRRVDTKSVTDHDRLLRGELVYLGGMRTPVCSLVTTLPFAGKQIPIMREVFANTDDCSLLLGWTKENLADTDTCDGRPRTREAAANRLARMIGLDQQAVSIADAEAMAKHVMQHANQELLKAIALHPKHSENQWIVSGHTHSMLTFPPDVNVIRLTERFGSQISRIGPAFAVCKLIENVCPPPSNVLGIAP